MAHQYVNHTGITAAPDRSAKMMQGMDEFPPTSTGGADTLIEATKPYAKDDEPFASPPKSKAIPQQMEPLADKMGARLAFERTGVRLYDGLLLKLGAAGGFDGGPSRDDLLEIREEERRHFELLSRSILEMGGDPTAVTPSADIQATAGKGLGAVIGDARTSLLDSLEAILVAELTDNESWEGLIEIADKLGKSELAEQFRGCLATEQEHLVKVRGWVAAGQGREVPTRH